MRTYNQTATLIAPNLTATYNMLESDSEWCPEDNLYVLTYNMILPYSHVASNNDHDEFDDIPF